MTQTICIVDAYSTGADLGTELNRRGFRMVHVQSTPDIPPDFLPSFRPKDFAVNIVYEGAIERAVAAVVAERPAYVIAGTETGVQLADVLAEALDLPGNAAASSALRRDKYSMNQAVRDAGLAGIFQIMTNRLDEAVEWARAIDDWPVVAKPVSSAGTDGVRFCHDESELAAAFKAVVGRTNRLGLRNDGFLVQERLVGQQYFLNAVSQGSRHRITEIWRDDKKQVEGAAMICDREILLPACGEVQDILSDYVRRTLDALGIQEGPSHTEIMVTGRGPVLIEAAARMQGTILHEAIIAALGESHVTQTALRYVDPDAFAARLDQPYELRKNVYCVSLAANRSGTVRANHCERLLSRLPSFFALFHTPQPGECIERTVDLFTSPGIVYLVHEDSAQLEADYHHIRTLEAEDLLFDIEPLDGMAA